MEKRALLPSPLINYTDSLALEKRKMKGDLEKYSRILYKASVSE